MPLQVVLHGVDDVGRAAWEELQSGLLAAYISNLGKSIRQHSSPDPRNPTVTTKKHV